MPCYKAAMVASSVMALVEEIQRRKLSRNKHFALFSRREYRQARRVQRYLDGLAAELESLAEAGDLDMELAPDQSPERLVLTVTVARLDLVRRCYLAAEELSYLEKRCPAVARHLADHPGLPLRCATDAPPDMQTRGDDTDDE